MSYAGSVPARVAFYASVAVVLVFALMPATSQPLPSTGWDKTDHFAVFAGLALLGMFAHPRRQALCMSALGAYGVLIELLQSFTAYRTAEGADLAADALGVALAFALVQVLRAAVSRGSLAAALPLKSRQGGR